VANNRQLGASFVARRFPGLDAAADHGHLVVFVAQLGAAVASIVVEAPIAANPIFSPEHIQTQKSRLCCIHRARG
jgi:hypothetical protein